MAAPMRQNTARDRSCERNLKEEEASPGGPANDYDDDDDDDNDWGLMSSDIGLTY